MGHSRVCPPHPKVRAEGAAWLKAKVEGTPGHGSLPREDNAVVRLSKALAKLTPDALPIHETPVARAFIGALAKAQPGLARVLLPQLFLPGVAKALLGRLPDKSVARSLNALLRGTPCRPPCFAPAARRT